ncbi:MAG TPA: hypothetical protein EYN66_04450 [Myxococcales bacterium]|nr:hypothetical protein [Myxococcales bacterium]
MRYIVLCVIVGFVFSGCGADRSDVWVVVCNGEVMGPFQVGAADGSFEASITDLEKFIDRPWMQIKGSCNEMDCSFDIFNYEKFQDTPWISCPDANLATTFECQNNEKGLPVECAVIM